METPKENEKSSNVFTEYSVLRGEQSTCSMVSRGQVKRHLEVTYNLDKSSLCGVVGRGQRRVDCKWEVGKW